MAKLREKGARWRRFASVPFLFPFLLVVPNRHRPSLFSSPSFSSFPISSGTISPTTPESSSFWLSSDFGDLFSAVTPANDYSSYMDFMLDSAGFAAASTFEGEEKGKRRRRGEREAEKERWTDERPWSGQQSSIPICDRAVVCWRFLQNLVLADL